MNKHVQFYMVNKHKNVENYAKSLGVARELVRLRTWLSERVKEKDREKGLILFPSFLSTPPSHVSCGLT